MSSVIEPLPVWTTLSFQRLRFSFDTMKDYSLKTHSFAYFGPTGGLRPRGPVSPKGEVSLVLVSKEDLGYDSRDEMSYREIIKRGQALGLKSARPCIGPQLLFSDTLPFDDFLLVAATPENLGYDPDCSSFCCMTVGREQGRKYISAEMLGEPDEESNWNGYQFIFEQ